jgi:hypothetical protein
MLQMAWLRHGLLVTSMDTASKLGLTSVLLWEQSFTREPTQQNLIKEESLMLNVSCVVSYVLALYRQAFISDLRGRGCCMYRYNQEHLPCAAELPVSYITSY